MPDCPNLIIPLLTDSYAFLSSIVHILLLTWIAQTCIHVAACGVINDVIFPLGTIRGTVAVLNLNSQHKQNNVTASSKAVITIAIRLRYDYDTTTTRLRRKLTC